MAVLIKGRSITAGFVNFKIGSELLPPPPAGHLNLREWPVPPESLGEWPAGEMRVPGDDRMIGSVVLRPTDLLVNLGIADGTFLDLFRYQVISVTPATTVADYIAAINDEAGIFAMGQIGTYDEAHFVASLNESGFLVIERNFLDATAEHYWLPVPCLPKLFGSTVTYLHGIVGDFVGEANLITGNIEYTYVSQN